uniref:Uncharacterized protein n=1 Tax=Wuchereria bancrofti TaxID=6293 RepID=A0AAF5PPD6_WUCBA
MMQTVAVRGQLKCGEKNVINTRVVLGIDIRFAFGELQEICVKLPDETSCLNKEDPSPI